MRKNQTSSKDSGVTTHKGRAGAFTFVEVMIALAIVSISLLALLELHVISVNMVDKARVISQAVFLANGKMAETLAAGFPEEGTRSGAVEENGLRLNWQTRVTSLGSRRLDTIGVTGLREVLVDVDWKRNVRPGHLRISTYVADRRLP
ncbi:MAG: hypothetical protein A2Z25_20370 [Planctomycetes bacterium RBG_16_55_9]|nr:MAG: hypothetical protein A2Z25_20370 [Planctomycetes bacterium RBG_16_55_9]